jgi:hypothetical protein
MKRIPKVVTLLMVGFALLACQLEFGIENTPTPAAVPTPTVAQADFRPATLPAMTLAPTPTQVSLTATPDQPTKSDVHDVQPVLAWPGYLYALPAGEKYDDAVGFLSTASKPVAYAGVKGASPEIESQLVALRDVNEVIHFWGRLECPVDDYQGCQLYVTRLRSGTALTSPEPFEGWAGVLVCGPGLNGVPGACGTTLFILGNEKFPIAYDTWAPEPALQEQLKTLRDTHTQVRLWGNITAGVIASNGVQIEVTRLEVVE